MIYQSRKLDKEVKIDSVIKYMIEDTNNLIEQLNKQFNNQ